MSTKAERFRDAAVDIWGENKVFRLTTCGAVVALVIGLSMSAISSIPGMPGSGVTPQQAAVQGAMGMFKSKLASWANGSAAPQQAQQPSQPGQPSAHPLLGGMAKVIDDGVNKAGETSQAHPIIGGVAKVLDQKLNVPKAVQQPAEAPATPAAPGGGLLNAAKEHEMAAHSLLGGLAKGIEAMKEKGGVDAMPVPSAPVGMVGAAPASSVPVLSVPDGAGAMDGQQDAQQVPTLSKEAMAPTVTGGVDLSKVFVKKSPAPSQSAP
jgi:hypothetical protein